MKIIEELKLLKSSLGNQLLYKNDLLNKRIKLSEIGELKNGYAFVSTSYKEGGKYKIITISNVTGERNTNTLKCNTIFELPEDLQSHQKLKINDILISLTGNVGRVSLCDNENSLLNQRVGLFIPDSSICFEYVFQAMSNQRFEENMIVCGQGAAQMNISKKDIEDYEIPYSSDEKLLEKIAFLLKTIDEKLELEKEVFEKYTEQKKYLLGNLFI